jgi:hypothetical protein
MPPILAAVITAEEFASLREVSKGMLQGIIPYEHRERLLKLGFVDEKFGGLVLTNDGATDYRSAVSNFRLLWRCSRMRSADRDGVLIAGLASSWPSARFSPHSSFMEELDS